MPTNNLSCKSCNVVMINGVKCHEIGCPDAWKDQKVKCDWCGQEFKPEIKWQAFCSEDCAESFNG